MQPTNLFHRAAMRVQGVICTKNSHEFQIVSQVTLAVQNSPADAGDLRQLSSIPGSGRYPAGGHGNPLQFSCLENTTSRGARRAMGHRVTKSRT